MLLKKISIACCLAAWLIAGHAQVTDNFSDGNFNDDPAWFGDDSLFIVNAGNQLQSKGSNGSSKDISLVTGSAQRYGEWNCWLKFALNPSSQNFCRFYLCSDQAVLKGSLNGYYVQLGGSTGNTDSISLYRQNGLQRTGLIAGRPGTVSKTSNVVQLKITCDSSGNWALWSDTTALGNFSAEGTATDNTTGASLYCGWYVKYTSGNVANYYFDDLYVGGLRLDTIPPAITGIVCSSATRLLISYTEPVDDATLFNVLNYRLDGLTTPASVVRSALPNSTEITFDAPLINGSNHTLAVSNQFDKSGNALADTTLPFTYYMALQNDIIFSELMVDPDPAIGLPPVEFAELYNNSKYAIQLNGWRISDASTTAQLPAYNLLPGNFVFVCALNALPQFAGYANAMGVTTLPSLNNTGDHIMLYNNQGSLINSVTYDPSYYHDVARQNGGYSLEMMNPCKACTGGDNWHASVDAKGGTPGMVNSAWSTARDSIAPVLIKAQAISADTIMLLFDEAVDSVQTLAACSVQVDSNQIQYVGIGSTKTILITLLAMMVHNKTYQVHISGVADCSGNERAHSIRFTYVEPRAPRQNQLLINEIMFAPSKATQMPDAEFIELYNASAYAIQLKDYTISDASSTARLPALTIYPDSFLLLCGSSGKALLEPFGTTAAVTNFPSLSATDTLTLRNNNGYLIHQLAYREEYMNNKLMQASGGYTLEMIDPANPCNAASNYAACADPGGGTPGRPNSIRHINPDKKPPQLLRIYPPGNSTLVCYFNESIDSMSVANATHISLSTGISPACFSYCESRLHELAFSFTLPFDTSGTLRITIDSVADCAANTGTFSSTTCMPRQADSGDIVINEILFNPYINGYDFVELYNRSNHCVDLRNLLIARYDDALKPEQPYTLDGYGYTLPPGQYLAITADPGLLKNYYTVPYPQSILNSPLPALNDDKGSVIILNKNGSIIDQVFYDDKMHFELLNNTEGVSLERVDPGRPSGDPTNWMSASANAGYATPACRNSQYAVAAQQGIFHLDPEAFSPDGDGYKDIITFTYELPTNANVGRLEIYSSNGSLVKKIAGSIYLGNKGALSWNGIMDNGEKAPVGIYIANFETFTLQGNTQQFQKSFVVSAK